MTQSEGERLARFLAHAGIASRRHAEELIAAGRVQVNGETITAQGARISPEHDLVTVDGRPVRPVTSYVYILLHKPVGYVTTASDPQRRSTVLDLLPEAIRGQRVYPVGRLDRDTSGLLLLTNDGDFALRLTHPRYSLEKRYHALVEGQPSSEALEMLRKGISIVVENQTYTTAPAKARILRKQGTDTWVELVIHEGRKRQVRRMLSTVGHPVLELKRVAIGPLTLGNLPVGQWRYLTEDEVRALQKKR